MSAPNIEGTLNPTATGGSSSGVVVGLKPTESLGFFGSAGTTQVTSASLADLAALKAYLVALGLLG